MNILKLHYVYCKPLLELVKDNPRCKCDNFDAFLRTTLLCSTKHESSLMHYNDHLGSFNVEEILETRMPKIQFLNELRHIGNSLSESRAENSFIFDLQKLNSTNWFLLFTILGDHSFKRLIQDFDIFMRLNETSYTQVVGADLSKRAAQLVKQVANGQLKRAHRDDFTDEPTVKRNKLSTYGKQWTPRRFLFVRDMRENVDSKLSVQLASKLLPEIFGLNHITFQNTEVTKCLNCFSKNLKRLNIRGLLDAYCPVNLESCYSFDVKHLSGLYTPNNLVGNYLRKVIDRLIPIELLGKKNVQKLTDDVLKYVVSVKRYDQFNLRCFTDGFKITKCHWLKEIKAPDGEALSEKKKYQIACLLVRWLLHFFINFVQRSFYITDSQIHKNRLLFYRKPLWNIVRRKMAANFIDDKVFSPFKSNHRSRSNLKFGPFSFRYLPKSSGFRSILFNVNNNDRKIEKMNNLLKPYLAILHDAFSFHPDLIGCQKSDFRIMRDCWRSFKGIYCYGSSQILARRLYFVKADLEACFDSLLHNKLFEILEGSLKPRLHLTYIVQNFCLICSKNGEPFRRYLLHAWSLEKGIGDIKKKILNFLNRRFFEGAKSRRKDQNNSVIITKTCQSPPIINRDEVIQILRQFICQHIVKFNRHFYLRKKGVAQGSAVSVALCNLYLAHFERNKLQNFQHADNGDLLMRHIDDYLYVTAEKERAVEFARFMLNGCSDYGLKSSIDKMIISFDDETLRQDYPKISKMRRVPWCGLTFDSITGHVFTDDDRWKFATDFSDFITVNYCKNANDFVLSRLTHYLTARNHEINGCCKTHEDYAWQPSVPFRWLKSALDCASHRLEAKKNQIFFHKIWHVWYD